MESLIVAFLALHKKCVLPGLGTFSLQQHSARYFSDTGKLTPPVKRLLFSRDENERDGRFSGFLANTLNVSEHEASEKIDSFIANVKTTCTWHNVELAGLGTFTERKDGLDFEPYPVIENESLDVGLQTNPVLHEDAPLALDTPKKDFWWLYAIILILAGLCAIFLQYT